MFKYIILIAIVAGGIYVGMNWDSISGKMEDGIETVNDIKDDVEDLKENAEDSVNDIIDKVKP